MQRILIVLRYQTAEPIRKPCCRAIQHIIVRCSIILFSCFWSCFFQASSSQHRLCPHLSVETKGHWLPGKLVLNAGKERVAVIL